MGKFYFSSPVPADRIYANQTAILTWLKSKGHKVEFARDPDDGRRPVARRIVSGLPVYDLPSPASSPPRVKRPNPVSPIGELADYVGKPCPYCGRAMTALGHRQATRDHKHPRSKGGTLGSRNKLIVCARCNNDKDSYTLESWYAALKANGDPRADKVGWILLEEGKGPPIRRAP